MGNLGEALKLQSVFNGIRLSRQCFEIFPNQLMETCAETLCSTACLADNFVVDRKRYVHIHILRAHLTLRVG